jgi:streptomycin 6-kinase
VSPARPFHVPPNLRDGIRRYGSESWLSSLPEVIEEVEARWELEVGDPFLPGGVTAWVAPARAADGRDVVLKLCQDHPEGRDEAEGLAVWDGRGAVRLLAAGELPATRALLLERCRPGNPLRDRPESEQDPVIVDILRRLWQAPTTGPFRPLAEMCDQWVADFEEKASARPVDFDPGLVRAGLTLFGGLARSAERGVLLCTDLHAGNVLAAHRQPWLMIDPKPYVGDPAYDVLQHLLNCPERLRRHPRGMAHHMADLLELDRERVATWLFARCVVESVDRPDLHSVARALAPA